MNNSTLAPLLLCLPIFGFCAGFANAGCNGVALADIEEPYEFTLSKASQVDPSDIVLLRKGHELTLASRVSSGTPIETRGSKISQRSEIRETRESSSVTRKADWICYAFAFIVTDTSSVPNVGEKRAKLSLAQFHQEPVKKARARPALLFELTPERKLELVFGAGLGGATHILVADDEDLFGKWWRIEIAARWSKKDRGGLMVWLGPLDAEPTLRFSKAGKNTTTGHVYQKLGAYRSFLERDPELLNGPSEIKYQDISRNGVPARIMRR